MHTIGYGDKKCCKSVILTKVLGWNMEKEVYEMEGYAGTLLFADLTKGTLIKKPFPQELKRQYLGGRGIGVKMVSDMVSPDADALGEKNVIVFAAGPLTGSGVPLGARHQAVSKSPLNDMLCTSDSGAFFGHELKVAGFDAVVVSGKAQYPVFLWLNRGGAEIRDASDYWGMTVNEVTAAEGIPWHLG